jgi:hypothetical protein
MSMWTCAGRHGQTRGGWSSNHRSGTATTAAAQVTTFGGNAQHTSTYTAPAQDMNAVCWSATIDESNTGTFAHCDSPLVTASTMEPRRATASTKSRFSIRIRRGQLTRRDDLHAERGSARGLPSIEPRAVPPRDGFRRLCRGGGEGEQEEHAGRFHESTPCTTRRRPRIRLKKGSDQTGRRECAAAATAL